MCYDDTARQQAIVSKRHLFANKSAEKEDEVYPVTVKEVAEVQRAHTHYIPKLFKNNKIIFNKNSNISARVISNEIALVFKKTRLVIPTLAMQAKVIQ